MPGSKKNREEETKDRFRLNFFGITLARIRWKKDETLRIAPVDPFGSSNSPVTDIDFQTSTTDEVFQIASCGGSACSDPFGHFLGSEPALFPIHLENDLVKGHRIDAFRQLKFRLA